MKRLLKPPAGDGEILFLPNIREFLDSVKGDSRIGVCHQPYFFNPGVSLKFLFLKDLPVGIKNFIFLDTDKVRLGVKVPFPDGSVRPVDFINSERVLYDYPTPAEKDFDKFFSFLEAEMKKALPGNSEVFSNFARFKKIVFANIRKKFLKEVLAESFLEFHEIKTEYYFLTDLLRGEEFREFYMRICRDAGGFRKVFNNALQEYKKEYRFRYRNYPFPALEEGEFPFWVLKAGQRKRCFEDDIGGAGTENRMILPRAAALTIFLRLYKLDFFIHGIGGANYEWVQDRIIERFFKRTPPGYVTISGTLLLDAFKERELPYFLFCLNKIKELNQKCFQKKIQVR